MQGKFTLEDKRTLEEKINENVDWLDNIRMTTKEEFDS